MSAEVHESFGDHGICAICKRNPVNRWCDYVVGYDNNIIFLRGYKEFMDANGGCNHSTCDLPMCDKCATNVSRERDFCPHHMSLHRKAELPDKYQRSRQTQAKMEIYRI